MRSPALLPAAFALLAACAPAVPATRTLRAPRQGLTHPILDIDPDYEFREFRPFRHKVAALIEQRKKRGDVDEVSVYFRDLDNGPVMGIWDSVPFRPASLLKLPIMIAYLKAREMDQQVLRRRLRVVTSPLLRREYFGPSNPLSAGDILTVDELLTAMIGRSDNAAVRTLLSDLKQRDYLQVYADLGLPRPNPDEKSDPVSVRGYASFFRILYNASYLNREMSERALRYLAAAEFKEGLRAGLPAGTVVAHKFGVFHEPPGPSQLHDCGIVYHPRAPYILCVMTRGREFPRMAAVIADISALVWRRVDGAPAAR